MAPTHHTGGGESIGLEHRGGGEEGERRMGAPQSALRCVHREEAAWGGVGGSRLGAPGPSGGPCWAHGWGGGGEGEARDTSWVGMWRLDGPKGP